MSPETSVSPRRSPAPVVISLLLAGALILALGYGVGKRHQSAAPRGPNPPGALAILAPRSGDSTSDAMLRLDFRTDAPLELTPRGWLAGPWHVHAVVDGRPRMAAASDIRSLGDGRYEWTLRPGPGAHDVQLVWADVQHRVVTAGASAVVRVHVRGPTPRGGAGG